MDGLLSTSSTHSSGRLISLSNIQQIITTANVHSFQKLKIHYLTWVLPTLSLVPAAALTKVGVSLS